MWFVWVFLAPLCPVCQDYTFYLNQLDEVWESEHFGEVELTGWFPNPDVDLAAIDTFRERYSVEWELAPDTVGWADVLDARWTPEVFVLDSLGNVRYRGRINDLYFALGKHRNAPRVNDLELALAALMAGRAPVAESTDVIGCPIESKRLFNAFMGKMIFPDLVRAN